MNSTCSTYIRDSHAAGVEDRLVTILSTGDDGRTA